MSQEASQAAAKTDGPISPQYSCTLSKGEQIRPLTVTGIWDRDSIALLSNPQDLLQLRSQNQISKEGQATGQVC